MTPNFIPPEYGKSSFTCPHCNSIAMQSWSNVKKDSGAKITDLVIAGCAHCHRISIWIEQDRNMIYPITGNSPFPNNDLPDDIKRNYLEARTIHSLSPRGSAALLRLCIQQLCVHLGLPGKDLNQDIGELVKRGLNPMIQKALDIVRIAGNESVHPGTMDIRDNPEIVFKLFSLVNIIADAMITQPKMISETFQSLPAAKTAGIAVRDKPKN